MRRKYSSVTLVFNSLAPLVSAAKLTTFGSLFSTFSLNPLPNGPRADACGFRDGLRRLPAINLSYNPLSTARREPGILVHVHPVLPRIAEASQLQLPRPGPDGQPTESSQLAPYWVILTNSSVTKDPERWASSKRLSGSMFHLTNPSMPWGEAGLHRLRHFRT